MLTRIAYFGLPLGALALIRAGHEPCIIVLGRTGALGTRRLRKTIGSRVPILTTPDLHDPAVLRRLADAKPDALLSWFYPKQIPLTALQLASRGAFGTHPSLLPRWRGPDPYFWALYSGDTHTGVSLHRLEEGYDTGAVIEQTTLALTADEDAWRLAKRLDRPALRLLVSCAQRLAQGDALCGTAQDEARVTLAPAPDETLLAVDWSQPVARIERLVRAAAPYPGATAELGEELVELLRVARYEPPLPRALEPADAVQTACGLVVCAGDGGLSISRARLASGALLEGEALLSLFPGGLARVGFASENSGTTKP